MLSEESTRLLGKNTQQMNHRIEDTQNSNPEIKPKEADPPKPFLQKRMDLSKTCLARIPGSEETMGLLNQLPRELRDMIYEEVLGNDLVYLSWFQPFKDRFANSRGHRLKGKAALLRTCRSVYVEAIRVLYSTNTFGFDFDMHTNTRYGFFRAIPSQHLAIITSMYIAYHPFTVLTQWSPSERKENWTRMWATIATEMQMLRIVTVRLGDRGDWDRYLREPGSEGWEEWFNSMACVTSKLEEIGRLLRFVFELDGTQWVVENQFGELKAISGYPGRSMP